MASRATIWKRWFSITSRTYVLHIRLDLHGDSAPLSPLPLGLPNVSDSGFRACENPRATSAKLQKAEPYSFECAHRTSQSVDPCRPTMEAWHCPSPRNWRLIAAKRLNVRHGSSDYPTCWAPWSADGTSRSEHRLA